MTDKMPTESGNSCSKMLDHLLDQKQDYGAELLSLVERYIGHFARRYGNLAFHEQQDIRQEVAVKLIAHGRKVRGNCTKSWVYIVARNECINHIRKRASQLVVYEANECAESDANAVGSMPVTNESTDVQVFERMDCLEKIFDRIESQDTGKADIAIYTQYAFGLSYVEISKRSKRTVDAIGQRISVLKGRLKNLMNECC